MPIYKLSDICTITKGNTGIMKAIDGEYTMVTLGEENKTHNEHQFDAKAVIIPLVSSTGHGHASMKRVKYFEGKFALGTILCAVIPKNDTLVLAKYLQIYLHQNREKLLVSLMKGAANVSLSIKKIYDVEVVIPSIETQLKVIDLEQKINESDTKLSALFTKQTSLLSSLKQAILQEAIQGKLTADWRTQNPNTEPATELLKRIKTEKMNRNGVLTRSKKEKPLPTISKAEIPFDLPEGWVWCRLGEVITSCDNKNIHDELLPNDLINYVDIEAIDNKNQKIRETKLLPVNQLSSRARRVLKKGNILYSLVRPYLHNLAFVEDEKPNMIGSTGFAVFGCLIVESKYIFWLLLSKYIEKTFMVFMDGFNSPSITHEQFKNVLIPLPPLEEQKVIVEKVAALLEKCTALNQEIETLDKHGKTLMKAMFNETFEAK